MLTKGLELFITAHTADDRQVWANALADDLTLRAGGCTIIESIGKYLDKFGRIWTEPSTVILCGCDNAAEIAAAILPGLAAYAVNCEQESVYFLVDGVGQYHETKDLEAILE